MLENVACVYWISYFEIWFAHTALAGATWIREIKFAQWVKVIVDMWLIFAVKLLLMNLL